MLDTTAINHEVVGDWYFNLHIKEGLTPAQIAKRQTLVDGLTAKGVRDLFASYELPLKHHKRAKTEANGAAEPTPEPDALDEIPALEVDGEKVAFLVQEDGAITDVSHRPAPVEDPGPGRRAIKADEFNELWGKIRGEAATGDNGHARQIIASVNLRIEEETYFHPIMGDTDRLFGRLCAGGIPAPKAIKYALRAAELARMGNQA